MTESAFINIARSVGGFAIRKDCVEGWNFQQGCQDKSIANAEVWMSSGKIHHLYNEEAIHFREAMENE